MSVAEVFRRRISNLYAASHRWKIYIIGVVKSLRRVLWVDGVFNGGGRETHEGNERLSLASLDLKSPHPAHDRRAIVSWLGLVVDWPIHVSSPF